MNFIKKLFIFVIVFLIAGCAIHYASFRSFGLFIWSFEKDPATEKSTLARTEIRPSGSGDVDEVELDDSKGANDEKKTEAKPEPPRDPNLVVLFNGKDLGKWKKTEFGGEGDAFVNEDGNLEFGFGAIMTGVHWGEEEPPARMNYEISLEAMKLDGNDFFLGLTFPYGEDYASLILGGWGGGIVGISSVDDLDASENETMNIEGFENNVWHKVKLRVTEDKIMVWLNERELIDLDTKDRKISLRPGDIELCVPLGIASFVTRAQYRNIELRKINPSKIGESNQTEAIVEPVSQKPEGGTENAPKEAAAKAE